MNKKINILLYSHGGSLNHGCEALVHTISQICCENWNVDKCVLATSAKDEDDLFHFHYLTSIEQVSFGLDKYSLKWWVSTLNSRSVKVKLPGEMQISSKKLKKLVQDSDVCIAIGGDNYCYDKGKWLWGIDNYIRSQNKKMILWGCSIEPEELPGELEEHLSVFDIIAPRESLTYDGLKNSKVDARIVKCSDSAFLLPIEDFKNDYFKSGKPTLGFNFSPLCISKLPQEDKSKALNNVIGALKHILDTTNYSILLIPHVLNSHDNDMDVLNKIFQRLNSKRVKIVDMPKINAKQIKYLISQCDVMVASRTHASIAAYSTYVPTLVIGYSIKSKGIATDLFGSWEDYVLPSDNLVDSDIINNKLNYVINNKSKINKRLQDFVPKYIKDSTISLS